MRRILVVDDSALMRAMYKHLLGQVQDCAVTFACDGKEALDHVAREEPEVMLLDVNMPVLDGLSVLDQLRADERLPRIRVVVVSTEGRDDDVRAAMDAGAIDYVRKPFRGHELVPVIERAFAR